MIVVRNVFQVKFGKAREAVALWQEGISITNRLGYGRAPRLLTDLVGGRYYTLVVESTFGSLSESEKASSAVTANTEWNTWYQKVVPFIESGQREILSIVE